MSRKKLWFISILVLSISLLSSQVFAQENQDPNFEIWPGDIDPPDGSVDILVPNGQNVVIRTSFRSCSRLLSRVWTIVDQVTLSIDGEDVVSTPKESWRHWGNPFPIPNEEGIPCVNGSNTLWVVDWEYDLGEIAPGSYPVHFEENVWKPYTDGADYDGDGRRDFFDWHVNVDFNIIVTELGGSISGTVTEQGTGLPVVDMEVAACPYDFDAGEYVEEMPCFSGWTEADGSYFIHGVPAGTYIVDSGWWGNWVPEIYFEQVDYGLADPVTVVSNENTHSCGTSVYSA